MLPVLFQIGQFELRTINIFLILAFLFGSFIYWRKGREEHYDETVFFDSLLLSLIFGLIVSRFVFIILNFSNFGFDLVAWIDIFAKPGLNYFTLFLAASVYLYRFAFRQKWDVFEILDFAALSLALAQVFIWLSKFFEGVEFGRQTALPIGIVFKGLFEPHHPMQLYFVIFYIVLFFYLSRVEYKYRKFEWYRAGKKTAQTGFLLSMFLIFVGLFNILMSFIKIPTLSLYGLSIDLIFSFSLFTFGLFLLLLRSGRVSTKFFGRRNKGLLEKLKV